MHNMRKDLFSHMEKLPIKYFDTHAHGDIMSVYTNDIDTLRQMISQSIPQLSEQRNYHYQYLYQYADPEHSAVSSYTYHGQHYAVLYQESDWTEW